MLSYGNDTLVFI